MALNIEAVTEEIEALQAIMPDEVSIMYADSGNPVGLEVAVFPSTAQIIDEQHVRVTLAITLPQEYPDVVPIVSLRNPRGVDDSVLTKILSEAKKKCEGYVGFPVIYELIELVRENLTANNTPSCPCAICLFHFTDDDVFTKTPCYHYFHSHCLGRYVLNCEEEAVAAEAAAQPSYVAKEKRLLMCPVCRDDIDQELNSVDLLCCPSPEAEHNADDFCPNDPDLVSLQKGMMALYLLQKAKGGIIDVEEERNKFLLSSATQNETVVGIVRHSRSSHHPSATGHKDHISKKVNPEKKAKGGSSYLSQDPRGSKWYAQRMQQSGRGGGRSSGGRSGGGGGSRGEQKNHGNLGSSQTAPTAYLALGKSRGRALHHPGEATSTGEVAKPMHQISVPPTVPPERS